MTLAGIRSTLLIVRCRGFCGLSEGHHDTDWISVAVSVYQIR